ncbi:hypothetical protein E2C01_009948 [Portunus trituberculatus]|uniref:Secreted protein n=1 Tax=Portunus trituberculatus TaxID=210409 RepID=A0A5B7D7C9_PORTR|nr:hypothetical protein [Portunus trituberculatus]
MSEGLIFLLTITHNLTAAVDVNLLPDTAVLAEQCSRPSALGKAPLGSASLLRCYVQAPHFRCLGSLRRDRGNGTIYFTGKACDATRLKSNL